MCIYVLHSMQLVHLLSVSLGTRSNLRRLYVKYDNIADCLIYLGAEAHIRALCIFSECLPKVTVLNQDKIIIA